MFAGAPAELLDFIVVHELLQIHGNLQIVIVCYRHCIEMKSILRLEVTIETDNDVFKLVYRFTLLIDRASKLTQQLLTILLGTLRFVIREESIRYQMFILYHLKIKFQTFPSMREFLKNPLQPFVHFFAFFLDTRPLVFITLTYHCESLFNGLDVLFDFRFLGKEILLSVAVSDDNCTFIFNTL